MYDLNPFLDVASYIWHETFIFSRKGGTGGGRWVHPKVDSMAISIWAQL